MRGVRRSAERDLDRALAAHLCRCTGWRTVYDALRSDDVADAGRDLGAAAQRAELEGGVAQVVRADIPLGGAPFADDTAPRDALVAVPLPPGSAAEHVEAAGRHWVVGASLLEARAATGKVQGRRTTAEEQPPLFDLLGETPPDGVRLATSWVEPAYLEPDASWCAPGGEARVGTRERRRVRRQSHDARDRRGARARRPLRPNGAGRLLPRRRGSARPEAPADRRDARCGATAPCTSRVWSRRRLWPHLRASGRRPTHATSSPPGGTPRRRPAGRHRCARATGLAEIAVLVEGALDAAGVDRASLTDDPALLDVCVRAPSGASAGARVHIDPRPADSIASKYVSRRATRSTRRCCGRTRSAPRTWRWAGCARSRSPSIPTRARSTT